MALKIVSADERMKEKTSIKGAIFGPHGIGKTSLLWTLPKDETLFIDIEGGGLAVGKWDGAILPVSTWEECLDVACIFGGPDMSKHSHLFQSFSQAHYDALCKAYPDIVAMRDRYHIHFWDSISVASRLCFQWAYGQPESWVEKQDGTIVKDTRATYGLVGRSIVEWLTHIQHTPGKIVWVVGGLDAAEKDFAHPWVPQIEGKQGANKLPGIFDEVISMVMVSPNDGGNPYRAFVTSLVNQWKYPAKDRSGCLDLLEPPHLGALIKKIEAGNRIIKPENYDYHIPTNQEVTNA